MKTLKLIRRLCSKPCSHLPHYQPSCNRPPGFQISGPDSIQYPIIAFGNATLEFAALVGDSVIHDKFQLGKGGKYIREIEEIEEIKEETAKLVKLQVNPGGTGMNMVRVLKHLNTNSIIFSAIGCDRAADIMLKHLDERCIKAQFDHIRGDITGQSVNLVQNKTNTIAFNLGASCKFSKEFLEKIDKKICFLRPPEKKQFVYIPGLFAMNRENVCRYILQNYIRGRCRLAINIDSPLFIEKDFGCFNLLSRKANIIFGNQEEFEVLGKRLKIKTIEDVAGYLMNKKERPIIIVITQGEKGVTVVSNYDTSFDCEPGVPEMTEFDPIVVEDIVDTTGAGDCFVAGFMDALMNKQQLNTCVCSGMNLAAESLTQVGCNLPCAKI